MVSGLKVSMNLHLEAVRGYLVSHPLTSVAAKAAVAVSCVSFIVDGRCGWMLLEEV